MGRDQQLRDARLIFYAEDIQRLDAELDGFLELSNARCALLIDKDGHLVTQRGEPLRSNTDSIAALIAGSFAATKEMARQLGEDEFTLLSHQGHRDSIQLQLIGNRTLLAALFDGRSNLGMVRFYAQETSQRLASIFREIEQRKVEPPGLHQNYSRDAAAALDKLF
jgi:predicted regulator of Ras-like GTPase activity (Roadblock/LC7/MglB family)